MRAPAAGLLLLVALWPARAGAEGPPARELTRLEELARGADVVAVGEAHDNRSHHAVQALVLDRLVAAGERPVVAFEMLAEDQQAAVDAAMREASTIQDLERRLAWRARGWPDFAMYYPLFQTAKRWGLPVLAADLDAESRRTISRRGLDALPEPTRSRVASRLPSDAAREDSLRRDLQTVHCDLLPPGVEAAMAEAWHARNVTMAHRVAEALGDGRKVVFLAGRAHLAPDAVPGQLGEIRPGTRVVIIDLVEEGSTPLPDADVVLATPRASRPDECAELRRRPPKWQ